MVFSFPPRLISLLVFLFFSIMDPNQNSLITSTPLNQIASIIHVKLRDNNFLVWKSAFLPLLKRFNALSFIDGSGFCPPQFLTRVNERNQTVNHAYTQWNIEDQTIILWVNSTISYTVFAHLTGASTAFDLWKQIEEKFSHTSSTHVIQLRTKLQTICQGNLTVSQFLSELKKITDALAAAGCIVSDSKIVVTILNGLHADYAAFATSIRVRYPPVTSRELHNLLLSEEMVVTDRECFKISSKKAFAASSDFQYAPYGYYSAPRAFQPSNSRGNRGRGRGWTPSFTKTHHSFHPQYASSSYYPSRPPPSHGWSPMPTAQQPPTFAQ